MVLLKPPSMPNPHREFTGWLKRPTSWRTECTCGYVTPWRPIYSQADKDRDLHFAEHARLAAFVAQA